MSGQLVQLASSVKVREAIYRNHMEASGGEINPAQQARGVSSTMDEGEVDYNKKHVLACSTIIASLV